MQNETPSERQWQCVPTLKKRDKNTSKKTIISCKLCMHIAIDNNFIQFILVNLMLEYQSAN